MAATKRSSNSPLRGQLCLQVLNCKVSPWYHSFKKSEAPHDLRFCLCLVSGQVVHAKCSCKAGQVGYCNHVLALMFKVCKFSLYDSKNTSDLCDEEDEQPDLARCTSQLQRWHKTGRGDKICKDMIATWQM